MAEQMTNSHLAVIIMLAVIVGAMLALLSINFLWNTKPVAEAVSPHYRALSGCMLHAQRMGCVTDSGEVVACTAFVDDGKRFSSHESGPAPIGEQVISGEQK